MSSDTSKIEYMYWPGKVLIPYDVDMNINNLRQVSQIIYHGPLGPQPIYIDYDEECEDIYIRADIVYLVNAGNVMYIKYKQDDVFLYNITIREILQNLILGNFDINVIWAENEMPNSILDEFVFQAPLSQIEVYYVPCMPCVPYTFCLPEENVDFVEENVDDFVIDFVDGFITGFNDAIDDINSKLDQAFNYGIEQGYNYGVSAGKYTKDCECELPDYCAICEDSWQDEIDKAFAYCEISCEKHTPHPIIDALYAMKNV